MRAGTFESCELGKSIFINAALAIYHGVVGNILGIMCRYFCHSYWTAFQAFNRVLLAWHSYAILRDFAVFI